MAGSIPKKGKTFYFSPPQLSRPAVRSARPPVEWLPVSSSSLGKIGQGVKLTSYLQPVPKLRRSGVIPPLPYTSCHAQKQLQLVPNLEGIVAVAFVPCVHAFLMSPSVHVSLPDLISPISGTEYNIRSSM